ncbi:MAG: RNA polymerase subunit sigma-70 [Lachnospiraceae bacterium]|jgi:RNA polymerase primary sigma factor|nr:RNA polymerase subunit sigma-70 [Lachnospiraceae bacterium]MCI9283661.1 RNA polymerase subunit sigma-70 [Lachnospiraceae bacterium]
MHDDVYQMYLEEVKRIPACTLKEEEELPGLAQAGDRTARQRLLEGMLHYVLELAGKYKSHGLTMGDLVQEANMALLLALESYEGGNFREQVKELSIERIQMAIQMQNQEKQAEEEMAARVNVLKDISQMMAEELGREATVEELAEKMKMTVDEIKEIMKVTLDAMNVSYNRLG